MASQGHQTQTQESNEYAMYEQSFDLSSAFARFVSTSNTNRFETVVLPKRESGHVYTFGRHKTCDFILAGSRFSNIHFKVWETDAENSRYDDLTSIIMVEDTSTNGTFLNQARIGKGQRTVLTNGDELSAGVGVAADEVRYLVQLPKRSRLASDAKMSPEATACMQKYEIRQILGSGAFATVRCAVNRSTGVKYAVKILNQRKLAITNASAKATELFKREIEILQSTRHPNIVQYVDMWADSTEIYLVLEYLPGGDLMDYIMRRGKLGEYDTVKIIQQILEALVYCHRIGIAHRDIKPENILLTSDVPPVAKLTDFGLAKMVEPGSFLKTFCGTLTYVAPEVISMHGRIAGAYSTAVDMWSIGCVTFIMLAGSMPFIADGQETMMQIIQEGDYDDAMLEEIELSGAGMDFIESLLRIDPKLRMSGDQALHHPWVTNIDYENTNGGPSASWSSQMSDEGQEEEMDHDSQAVDNDAHIHEVQNDSSQSAFAFDEHIENHYQQQQPRRPGTRNGYGLFDESSVDWGQVDRGQGRHYTQSERESYLARLNSEQGTGDRQWNPVSHFSQDSSAQVIGSSQYASASSQVQVNDSTLTITPQRLKNMGVLNDDKRPWIEHQKENTGLERQFVSEPVIRHK